MIQTLNDIMLTNRVGVLYLDEDHKIVSENRVARSILDEGRAISRRGKELIFSDSKLKKQFQQCIRATTANNKLGLTEKAEDIFVKDDVDQLPVRLSVHPFLGRCPLMMR